MRLAAPAALVDIERVDGLDTVEVTDAPRPRRARVRHARLRPRRRGGARDPAAAPGPRLGRPPGDPQPRHHVGSIVHADPAAELPAVLALLGGHVELASTAGRRTVAAVDFLLGPLESDTPPGRARRRGRLPAPAARTGSAVRRARPPPRRLRPRRRRVTRDARRRPARHRAPRSATSGSADTPGRRRPHRRPRGQAHDALDLDAAPSPADGRRHTDPTTTSTRPPPTAAPRRGAARPGAREAAAAHAARPTGRDVTDGPRPARDRRGRSTRSPSPSTARRGRPRAGAAAAVGLPAPRPAS
jgi:hypothetical protein